jgi:hypothetical protein
MIEITHSMLDDLRSQVSGAMSPKRFRHTVAVEAMTERLCNLFCPELCMVCKAKDRLPSFTASVNALLV